MKPADLVPLTADSVLCPAPDVVARDVAGEHLLVPVRSGVTDIDSLYTCNAAGAFLFSRLDGRTDVAALARALAAGFEVGESEALRDALAFLGDLQESGLAIVVSRS
jgi:hypothetical protein